MKPLISHYQFSKLPLISKASLAYFEGTYLGITTPVEIYKVALYAQQDFYIELWYLKQNGQLEKIKSYTVDQLPHVHLQKIDIAPLLRLLTS